MLKSIAAAGRFFWRMTVKSLEDFFYEVSQTSREKALSRNGPNSLTILHPELCEAVHRGLEIFPVPEVAQWTRQPERLIEEATCDISRLKVLAVSYPSCAWRAVAASPGLCVLQLDDLEARAWFAINNEDRCECHTLATVKGQTVWAIFQWPMNLVLRESAKSLGNGVRILTEGDSFPIPPSKGSTWADPSAEIEAIPYWIRKIAFEPPNGSPAPAAVAPSPTKSARCRADRRVGPYRNDVRKGKPSWTHASWRAGFRLSRRR